MSYIVQQKKNWNCRLVRPSLHRFYIIGHILEFHFSLPDIAHTLDPIRKQKRPISVSGVVNPTPAVLKEEPNGLAILVVGGERKITKKTLKSNSRLLSYKSQTLAS